MKWKRETTWLLLLAVWVGLAAWQWGEYQRVRRSAFAELHREAHAVNTALIGGIRTHRGMGRLFEENIQEAINDVVASETVIAAAIETGDGARLASAGNIELLDADEATCREASAFAFHDRFELQQQAGSLHGGQGQGGQGFGGPGRDRGPGWGRMGNDFNAEAASAESTFRTTLLLDASATESRCRSEVAMRGLVIAAGTLVLLCIALAWRSSLRAAEAQGRASVLEGETRHLRDLSQAAAGLAHETRNPLSLIRGWTQRMDEECSEKPEQHKKALAIIEECDRVTARINQFLSFARPADPQRETMNVSQTVDELAALLEPIFEAKNLTFRCDAIPKDLSIEADREMFRQALFNLIQNAVQFAPDGSEIEISASLTPEGRQRIAVLDRGPGVSDENVESLFTPYFTTRPDGTGLGLAIVRRIAVAHGWEVGYNSREDGGSVFWLDQIDD